jgi:tetratricopeptide (TPR) repeat protein
MPNAKISLRKEKRDLRERMRAAGCDYRQIAAEFARAYRLRPRAAWREAYGLDLADAAERFNTYCGDTGLDPRGISGMTAAHLCEYENWPGHGVKPTGRKPSPYLLAVLARMYGCQVSDLLDAADRSHLPPSDLLVIDTYPPNPLDTRGACSDIPAQPAETAAIGSISRQQASPSTIELCTVLTDYGFGLGQFSSPRLDRISSLADLERDLGIAFSAYQQSRFAAAASRASTLLADAQLALRECDETARARHLKVLALSYQVAASVLTKVGQPYIGWIAAERGLNAAEASGVPAVRGSLIRSVAFSLHSTGRLESAMRLVESATDYLERELTADAAILSVYGTLFLVGSMAAARFGDRHRTHYYLREADRAAVRLGKDGNHLWTAFGPTNVAIHRVNTAVELDDIQTVLDSGLSLDTSAVPVERRVRHLLDVARAYSLTGDREHAVAALLTAERLAPEHVRQHYLTGKVIVLLVKGAAGRPSVELDKLAERVNVRELV